MNRSTSDKRPWEEWQLTAFVLGELEPDLAEMIRASAKSDAALLAEIEAIRSTLTQVTKALKEEESKWPVAPRRNFEIPTIPTSVTSPTTVTSHITAASPSQTSHHSQARSRTLFGFGLLAMAASLLVATWFSFPSVSDWMMASNDQTPHASPTNDGAKMESSQSVHGEADAEDSPAPFSYEGKPSNEFKLSADGAVATNEPMSLSKSSSSTAPQQELLEQAQADIRQTIRSRNQDIDDSRASGGRAAGHAQGGEKRGTVDNSGSMGVTGGYRGNGGYGGDNTGFGSSLVLPGAQSPADVLSSTMGGYGAPSSNGQGGYGGGGNGAMGAGQGGYGGAMGSGMGGYGDAMGGYGDAMGGYGDAMGGYGDAMGGYGLAAGKSPSPLAESEALSVVDERGLRAATGESEEARYGFRIKPFGLGQEATSDRYESIVENAFQIVDEEPLSTFSIDVDTASYAKCRQLLMEASQLPPAAAVRLEEFINYFDYQYTGPTDDAPVAAHLAVTNCPWQAEHKLVRIALQAPKLELADRPPANIVFLLDVSGSMDEPNKLPLVKEAMRMLIEQLGENDRVAMVVYAGAAGCVLESTRGDKQTEILAALERLSAGGSTNGGDGIHLAYSLARDHYIPGGINRVVLCTDGDFNVGVTNTQALVDLVVEEARSKTFLTVLGFGMGNTNDAMMEQISNRGNGVYGFVDSWREAKRQMVQQLVGNLMTVAKDVKLQVEFNPQQIKAYRLLGYENRLMAAEDFNDDRKDAGEIGAGHRVTALYEVVPLSSQSSAGRDAVDELRYQRKKTAAVETIDAEPLADSVDSTIPSEEFEGELLAVKLRYKQPEGETSQLKVFPLVDSSTKFTQADADMRWAASMAQFGMMLRGSRYSGSTNWSGLLEQATAAAGNAPDPQREECLQMIRRAAQLSGQ